jgi:hypothetical protein
MNVAKPTVREVLPELAAELREALVAMGQLGLATQVESLVLFERCRCGDDYCAMFYTAEPPVGAWGSGFRNVPVETRSGGLVLDVVHDRIVAVEVLFRPDIRDKLGSVLPLSPEPEER